MLTKEEKSWLRKMQNLLDKCPAHFEFNTVGDADLTVFDNRMRDKIEAVYQDGNAGNEYCGAIEDAGAFIASLRFPNLVHSTAG